MYFSGTLIASLIGFMSQRGFSQEELCDHFQIKFTDLQDPDFCFNEDKLEFVWRTAAKLSGDPLLGLHMGENSGLTAVGIVGSLIQTSPTIEDALTNACKFMNLLTDSYTLSLIKHTDSFKIRIAPSQRPSNQHEFGFNQLLDLSLVFILKEYRALTLRLAIPDSVTLTSSDGSSSDEYRRIFNCPVTFRAKDAAIFFPKGMLSHRIITSDYKLLSILKAHAESRLSELEKKRSFASVVRQVLWNQSGFNSVDAYSVASHLNMTVRNMQRKLKKEGVRFHEISDEVKKNIALDYLKTGAYQVKQVSRLLGYNEVSSFTRSFKKWTGSAPTAFMKTSGSDQ
jgi:AraC-like DNA-binding protein